MNNNQQQPLLPNSNEATPVEALGFQLRKGLDRIGFEADKLMRSNRIRSEANRLRDQADEGIIALGRKVMEMSEAGAALDPELQALVSEIKTLEAELERKKREIEAVNVETWVAPPAPVLPPRPSSVPRLPASSPSQHPQISSPSAQTSQQTTGTSAQKPEQPRAQAGTARECPVCHAELRPNAAFCANCGYKLAQA